MKNVFPLVCIAVLAGCSHQPQEQPREETPFYEKAHALPADAREWAAKAPLADLCRGTKNWRHEYIREAALDEIKARDIDTRECYYTGIELTP